MIVTVYDPADAVLVEARIDWEPFTEGIYGDWVGDDDHGYHPWLGTRTGEQLVILPFVPQPMRVQRVTADGAAIDLGPGLPLNLVPGNVLTVRRGVAEVLEASP